MEFQPISIEVVLAELVELKAESLDATAVAVVQQVRESVGCLRLLGHKPSVNNLCDLIRRNPMFLDCCRLFLGVSQETAAHELSAHLQGNTSWTGLRGLAKKDPVRLATALGKAGLPDVIYRELRKVWSIEDVLLDRYKMSRGRAIAGQLRGRGLEEQVAAILEGSVPFQKRVTFTGREGKTAKCDIAIPDKNHPKIVIEAKGFEATGSKLTDFLGDIGKIILAKESRMYFFVVTDGRGWLNRKSDLQHVVNRQHNKDVDMVYTSVRLRDLKKDVEHIWKHELSRASGRRQGRR